jgi:phosphohistidine phosphatase
MKTLLIVRHAKSSWEDFAQPDFERPLNERGKKDAPEMAARIREKGLKIDLFVSSPAKRALRTARYFAEAYKQEKEDILQIEKLYEAPAARFYEVINQLNDKHETIALFSHNPGITDFVNTLTQVRIDNMPTCAVFAVSIDTKKWAQCKEAEKSFLFFDYPKNPIA